MGLQDLVTEQKEAILMEQSEKDRRFLIAFVKEWIKLGYSEEDTGAKAAWVLDAIGKIK